jgi:hypothetical protein
MPWQAYVFDVVGELVVDDETGILVPAYPESVLSIMRQQGKTSVAEAWMWDRGLVWEAWDHKPQSVMYSAQNGSDGRNKFRRDLVPTWKRSEMWRHVDKPFYAADNTGLRWRNDAFLAVMNSAASSGHGFVFDAAFLDEMWDDVDNRREQAMVPAMATRHDRQKMIASAAGNASSVVWNRKMTNGRAAVDGGRTSGIAYFEWSADRSDPQYDPESPTTWRRCMPALGITITERMVRQAFDEMLADADSGGVEEFERAWLNIPKVASIERVIPPHLWEAVKSPTASPAGVLAVAADAAPDLSWSAIAVADSTGNVEMVDYQPGVGWVVDRLASLAHDHHARVSVGRNGPLGFLIDDIKRAGVMVVEADTNQVVRACGRLMQLVSDRLISVRHTSTPAMSALEAAVASAGRRPVGDLFVWARSGVDVSPLFAVTLAVAAAANVPKPFLV